MTPKEKAVEEVTLRIVDKLECINCGEEVDVCGVCNDELTINEPTYCRSDGEHLCYNCYLDGEDDQVENAQMFLKAKLKEVKK